MTKTSANDISRGFLFTDLYELTMAQHYFRAGIHETPAQFDYFFRNYPDYGAHKAGYCIHAGLEWLMQYIETTQFNQTDMQRLREIKRPSGAGLFEDDFLDWLLHNGAYTGLDIEAIPEGRVVHPNVPVAVVRGPLALAQLLETALLNRLNFQTLIATKASRIRESGRRQLFMDFGMRRAQGPGANAATRAALIGGADFSSNTGMSLMLGYPPKGTHAHSMVQAFMALGMDEYEAFRQFADSYPDHCILLVDTINTLESGVPNAIRVFEYLRKKGYAPAGIRLDSGDLAYLAVESAAMLNRAGFTDCRIVLSNQLDEYTIQQIIEQIGNEANRKNMNAADIVNRLAYGVGTHLVTSSGAPALDGVYKLVAIQKHGQWRSAIKISETPAKIPNPGSKVPWRIYDRRHSATADLLCLAQEHPQQEQVLTLRHPLKDIAKRTLSRGDISGMEPLLAPAFRDGKCMTERPDIDAIRRRKDADLERLDVGVKRIVNPHVYHVSLSEKLWELKNQLVDNFAMNP
jgi:nicotinate phosphoribosyltransferase